MTTTNLDFIHRFIPAAQGQESSPVLVLLHGTGGDETDLLPIGQALLPGAALLGIRGKVLENGMPRFFRRLAEGVFDEEDLVFRTREIAEFLRQAVTAYDLGDRPLYAVGYSNGANIAASLLLLEPGVLRKAVLFRAMIPLTPGQLPNLAGTSVFMSCGRQDPIIDPAQSEGLATMLREAGADVDLYWQNTGHGLIRPELGQATSWLESNV